MHTRTDSQLSLYLHTPHTPAEGSIYRSTMTHIAALMAFCNCDNAPLNTFAESGISSAAQMAVADISTPPILR